MQNITKRRFSDVGFGIFVYKKKKRARVPAKHTENGLSIEPLDVDF